MPEIPSNCPHCRARLTQEDWFCPECGAQIKKDIQLPGRGVGLTPQQMEGYIQKLKDYIIECHKKQIPREMIASQLVQTGWPEDLVQAFLKEPSVPSPEPTKTIIVRETKTRFPTGVLYIILLILIVLGIPFLTGIWYKFHLVNHDCWHGYVTGGLLSSSVVMKFRWDGTGTLNLGGYAEEFTYTIRGKILKLTLSFDSSAYSVRFSEEESRVSLSSPENNLGYDLSVGCSSRYH